jgi:hypothetical protein
VFAGSPIGTGAGTIQFLVGLKGDLGGVTPGALDPGQQGTVCGAGQVGDDTATLVGVPPLDDGEASPVFHIVPGEAGKGVSSFFLRILAFFVIFFFAAMRIFDLADWHR